MPIKKRLNLQPYPREGSSLLALGSLFPPQTPPLSDQMIITGIQSAFQRTFRNRLGETKEPVKDPEGLVKICIKHLRTRSSPILGTHFLSQCVIDDFFILDAIPHEMQRQRMSVGVFYQYLIIELMRASSKTPNSSIEAVFDGSREGNVIADIKTLGFSPGLRIYGSVKKSSDTVGGQDVPGVISRLEGMAKSEKNITRPYICIFGCGSLDLFYLILLEDDQVKFINWFSLKWMNIFHFTLLKIRKNVDDC